MLTVQSDFSEYEARLEELREEEDPSTEDIKEFLSRVRYERRRSFEDFLDGRNPRLKDRHKNFRDLETETRKFFLDTIRNF